MTKKMIVPIILIVFMTIGYSAVSTTLDLKGSLSLETGFYGVRFSNVYVSGSNLAASTISRDGRSFTYDIAIEPRIFFEISNTSPTYDARTKVECSVNDENLYYHYVYNEEDAIPANSKRIGGVFINIPSETVGRQLTCTLITEKMETAKQPNVELKAEKDYLAMATTSATEFLGQSLKKADVETVTFNDTNKVPENAILSWDVSNEQNGSIMAYTLDEDSNNKFELYIGQNGGVNANPNSEVLFFNFTNVREYKNMENFHTDLVMSMFCMFVNNKALTSINLNSLDVQNCMDISSLFRDNLVLTTVGVSTWNTHNVVNMARTFDGCGSLQYVDLSKWNTGRVASLDRTFFECRTLKNLDVSNFDTTCVYLMSSLFYNCKSLTSLDLSKWNTSNVTKMDNMFSFCDNLTTTITIRGTDCEEYSYMFHYAARTNGSKIIVRYTSDASELVDEMITTKHLSESNVVKGESIPQYSITVTGNNTVLPSASKSYDMTKIQLSSSEENEYIKSFKLNGEKIIGDTFIMPSEDVSISEIETVFIIIEDEHTFISKIIDTEEGRKVFLAHKLDYLIKSYRNNGNAGYSRSFLFPEEDTRITDVKAYKLTVNGTNVVSNQVELNNEIDITLSPTDANTYIASFKLNGEKNMGDTFTMPNRDVEITEIEIAEKVIIETEHNHYQQGLNETRLGFKNFPGAKSVTVIIDYELYYSHYIDVLGDSKRVKVSNGRTVNANGEYAIIRQLKSFIIPGENVSVLFTSREYSPYNLYGFKAVLVPNYN